MIVDNQKLQETYFGHKHKTVIKPSRSSMTLNLGEVWAYRELLSMLVWRDVSVRYKQSLVGIGWAIIQPLFTMIIFTIIFGRFAKLPSDGVPYPVFSFCALLPWNYFSRSLGGASDSLVSSANLITKVYFPRLILPLSRVFTGLVDFAISFLVLLAMMVWYRITPTIGLLLLPLLICIAMITALGIGLWLTALNVKYRDIAFVVPFITQFWMFASPVAYSTSIVPQKWQWLYGLNPMAGVIEGFRWALLGKTAPDFAMMLASFVGICVIFITGLIYFKRMERTFADVV